MGADHTQLLPSAFLIQASADRSGDEFVAQLKWFRLSLEHLLQGLDPEIAELEGGVELLAERVSALPDNIELSWQTAGEIVSRGRGRF